MAELGITWPWPRDRLSRGAQSRARFGFMWGQSATQAEGTLRAVASSADSVRKAIKICARVFRGPAPLPSKRARARKRLGSRGNRNRRARVELVDEDYVAGVVFRNGSVYFLCIPVPRHEPEGDRYGALVFAFHGWDSP